MPDATVFSAILMLICGAILIAIIILWLSAIIKFVVYIPKYLRRIAEALEYDNYMKYKNGCQYSSNSVMKNPINRTIDPMNPSDVIGPPPTPQKKEKYFHYRFARFV